jgi:hypothetical protein
VAPVVNPLSEWATGDAAILELPLGLAAAPAAGSLLEVDLGLEQLWLTVLGVSGGVDRVRLSCQGLWLLAQAPTPPHVATANDVFERLTLQLWARSGQDAPLRLSDLAFDSRHPRFWGNLPSDLDLFPALDSPSPPRQVPALWREAGTPRFPLAGPGGGLYLPVAVPSGAIDPLGPLAKSATPLERDGLAQLSSAIFLDPGVATAGVGALLGEANYIRYESSSPRELTGIHAALAVDEATLIAAPDVMHRGWQLDYGPSAGEIPPRPEAAQPKAAGEFERCGIQVVPVPTLNATKPDEAGTFSLSWTSVPDAQYDLEESSVVGFGDAAIVFSGSDSQTTIYGHTQGNFYYRVRARVGQDLSDWSDAVGVSIRPPGRWVVVRIREYSSTMLVEVQQALLRLCAARGDLFASLALPEHYREDSAVSHAALLSADALANSYGAIYHPWLISPESSGDVPMRPVPPDGAACGVAARRALARGAWISPANEPLLGVVAVTPPLSPERWLDLQTAQLNVVRQDPRGFLALSADTLASEPELRPINVRRLLQLLRRLALRLGTTYVFEPNDAAFRRLVQRAFELMLGNLLERGAFAGSTAATAFQVVTGASLNTPASVDQGRFVVELRVAPSQPLTFLTVRLIQLPNGSLIAQENL